MTDQVYFEDVQVGAEIPSVVKEPDSLQLVQWAAGSGDFYQIHYDAAFAKRSGLDGTIVHGALKHAFLGELLYEWVAPGGRVKRVACSYRGMDPPDQRLTHKGKVTRKYQEGDRNIVELEIWVENADGQNTTPGSAIVTLPSRASPPEQRP